MAKNRIPKRIAGIKVPKGLRKSKILRSMLGSKLGREILASALTAGAGAAAAVLAGDGKKAKAAGEEATKRGSKAAGLAAEALESAATTAFRVIAEAMQPDEKTTAKTPKRETVKH